jgi:hypothetical protein
MIAEFLRTLRPDSRNVQSRAALLLPTRGDDMAFSGSSYFAGVGTVVAAIGLGFACGAMMMNSMVQPPNRLERVNAGPIAPSKTDATPSSAASSGAEQASTAKPPAQDAPPSPVVAAAPSPAANSQPTTQTQPAAPAAAKTDAATNVQDQPALAAKSNDSSPAKSERTTVGRAPDPSRDASRKRADERKPLDGRKFSERRRRHDQDQRQLDEATNVVRQMPHDGTVDVVAVRDEPPRFGGRPRHFGFFEDDDSPRVIQQPPPRFGFFGN